jgi:hypothetical protein
LKQPWAEISERLRRYRSNQAGLKLANAFGVINQIQPGAEISERLRRYRSKSSWAEISERLRRYRSIQFCPGKCPAEPKR